MAVGDFARAFAEEAARTGINLTPQTTRPWLSGLGHLDPVGSSAPSLARERLADAYQLLGGTVESPDLRKRRSIAVDFMFDDDTIVELDEFQHFTSARLSTLDLYDGTDHGLDIDLYRKLCNRTMSRADTYFASKTAVGFAFPGGRRSQRAYLDICRDLLGPANGERVVRIAAAHSSVEAAVYDLNKALT